MNIVRFFISFSIIIYTINGGDLNSKIDLVKSVLDNFHCHSVIFLSEDTANHDINYLKRFNRYNSQRNNYYGSSLTLSTFWKANESGYKGDKRTVTVLEINDRSIIPLLEKMTKAVDISSFIWLVITQTLTTEDFENLTIPVSSEFIIAKETDLGFDLSELYNVDEKKKLKKYAGIWYHSEGRGGGDVRLSTENYYRRRRNLEGGRIKVISPLKDPCTEIKMDIGIYLLVQCINLEYWNTIAGILNATTEIIVDPGLNLDSIITTDADLTLRSAPMNSFEMSTRSFMWAIYPERVRIVARLIGQNVGWKTFINPYDKYMWAAILMWMIFCELIMIAVEFIIADNKEKDKPFLNYYRKYSFLSFFAFCNQVEPAVPKLLSYRIVYFFIFLVPALLIPGYGAVLTSFLTVELPKMPFRNLDELSKTKDYRLGFHKSLPIRNLFNENNTNPMIYKLFHDVMLPEDQRPATDIEGMERLCTENFVYITSLHTQSALQSKCRLYLVEDHLLIIFTTMEVKKDSMYLFLMNKCVRQLEFTGVSFRLKTEILHRAVSPDRYLKPTKEYSYTSPENIVLPFVILLGGMIISFLILSLEKLRFNFSTKTKISRKNDALFVRLDNTTKRKL